MWNRSLSAAIIDCVTACVLLIAAVGLIKCGWEYSTLIDENNRLIEAVEEISAEKAMLEGLIEHTRATRSDMTNHGWIPPTELEN